jgi:hypothetical protein
MSAIGPKQAWASKLQMSAIGPKRAAKVFLFRAKDTVQCGDYIGYQTVTHLAALPALFAH